MATPKLDHIVILLPVSATPEALLYEAEPFKKDFTLSPGGFHIDKKTQNFLISLADGVYIELIAFTSGSATKDHPWAQRKPTRIINFAFLGHPDDMEAYNAGRPGGRGECEWIATMPKEEWGVGRIPFWCEDVTPRDLRVPRPTEHPSGVKAVKKITVLVDSEGQQEQFTKLYQKIIGAEDLTVGTPSGGDVTIDIRVAESKEEQEAVVHDGQGVYKVEFDIPGVILSNSIF